MKTKSCIISALALAATGCASEGDLLLTRDNVTMLPTSADVAAGTTRHGQARIVGDLDNDGMDEIVVIDPDLQIPGDTPECEARAANCRVRGGMHLVYGREDWTGVTDLISAGVRVEADHTWGNGGLTVDRAGDLDGDGFDDLVVVYAPWFPCSILGPYDDATPADARHGRVYVVYGGRQRLTAPVRIGAIAAATMVDPGSCTLRGASALGDIDDDGLADVAIRTQSPAPGQSRSYVFYGRRARLGGPVDLVAAADAALRGGSTSVILEPTAAGDVDDDGIDDWLAREVGADSARSSAAVVRGSVTRLIGDVAVPEIASTKAEWDGFDIRSGGDLDGDGRADLIALEVTPVPGSSPGDGQLRQRVLIAYGRPGASATIPADGWDAQIDLGNEVSDTTTAFVDRTGDGRLDVVVGHSAYAEGRGAAHVIPGSTTRFAGELSIKRPPFFSYLGGVSELRCGPPPDEYECPSPDLAGRTVSAGDINGDGREDLLVDAPSASGGSGHGVDHPSRAYLLLGK